MDFTTQSVGLLPSDSSPRSPQRFSSSYNSEHILAYLYTDSLRSMKSVGSHELYVEDRGTPLQSTSETQPSANGVWWHNSTDSKPIVSRPSLKFDKIPGSGRSRLRTTPGRRRPPALNLDGISSEPRIIGNPATVPTTPKSPKCLVRECGPALRSPWDILKDFPSPPSTPTIIRGSKTSISISRILRRGGNIPDVSTLTPGSSKYCRDFAGQQDENMPPAPRSKKKRHASFGSLGKTFKATPGPVPQAPLPAFRLNSDRSSSTGRPELNELDDLHRRDTFKSKLFSITTSPQADTRDGIARLPSTPTRADGHYIPHREARAASCTGGMEMTQGDTKRHKHRARSESQPIVTTINGSEKETENLDPGFAECLIFNGVKNPLIVPSSRTRSPSYLNVWGLSWRQASLSPTRTSSTLGGVISTPNTPVSLAFEFPNEIMHLPASTSAQSLRAEVDAFGTKEPTSFFRSEYNQTQHVAVATNRDIINFYQAIGTEAAVSKGKSRKSGGRPGKARRVPKIVVSSSTGLTDLKNKRHWMLD